MATLTQINRGTTANDGTGDTARAGALVIDNNFTAVNNELTTATTDVASAISRIAALESAAAEDGWSFTDVFAKGSTAPAAPTGILFSDSAGFSNVNTPWSFNYPQLIAGDNLYTARISANPDNVVSVGAVIHVWTAPSTSTGTPVTTFSSPNIPQLIVNTAITPVQFAVTNPAAGETFTYAATNLPSGLTLSSAGLLSGTPTTTGLFNVLVTATGSNGTTLTTRPRIDVKIAPVVAQSSVFWQASNTAPTTIPDGAASGVASADQTITIPETTDNAHLVIVQPATVNDLTAINFGGLNQIGAFTKGDSTFTFNSVNYEYWISNNVLFHADIQGQTLELERS